MWLSSSVRTKWVTSSELHEMLRILLLKPTETWKEDVSIQFPLSGMFRKSRVAPEVYDVWKSPRRFQASAPTTIIMPINYKDTHWVLVYVERSANCNTGNLYIFDALKLLDDDQIDAVACKVVDYVNMEFCHQKWPTPGNKPQKFEVHVNETRHQVNSSDCGIYVVVGAYCLQHNISSVPNPEEMTRLVRRSCYDSIAARSTTESESACEKVKQVIRSRGVEGGEAITWVRLGLYPRREPEWTVESYLDFRNALTGTSKADAAGTTSCPTTTTGIIRLLFGDNVHHSVYLTTLCIPSTVSLMKMLHWHWSHCRLAHYLQLQTYEVGVNWLQQ